MKVKIRTVIAAMAVALAAIPAQAQDLLARQAPIDKRMRAIDSISLHRMLPGSGILPMPEYSIDAPSAALYPEWNNEHGRDFGVALPTEYKIDLRNFCMPCDSRMVTSRYGYRKQFRRNHYGTDMKLYVGDTVRAAFNGKIRIVDYERAGYGNYVVIRHENGLETVYGHLSKHLVRENQSVRAGEPIGLGGNTGRSTGSHLHFETRLLGQYINPELLFDFEAQDARGDFYVYRSKGKGSLIGNPHHAATPVPMMAQDNMGSADQDMAFVPVEEIVMEEMLPAAEPERAVKNKASKKEKASKKKVHSVKKGDTLYSIAHKYNTSVAKLCKMNHISEKTILRPGQVLKCS